MGNQKLEYSNYVLFVLQSEQTNTLEMDEEPDGWSEDDLEIIRNKKYHGIVTQFTNGLKFRGYEKDFINDGIDQVALLIEGEGNGRRDYLYIYEGTTLRSVVKQKFKMQLMSFFPRTSSPLRIWR